MSCQDPSTPTSSEVSHADRVASIFKIVQDFYTEHPVRHRLTNLKIVMFTDPDSPHAKTPSLSTSGAETKGLLNAMWWVMKQVHDGSQLHHDIVSAFEGIGTFVRLIDIAEIVPTDLQYQGMRIGSPPWPTRA